MTGPDCYRLLLRLYPAGFREEYGDDMVLLFARQSQDEPTGRVWSRVLLDLALTVPAQHLEVHMKKPARTTVPIAYAVVAAAGVVFAGTGGTSPGTLGIGAAVALTASVLAFVAYRRSRGLAETSAADGVTTSWWRFLAGGTVALAAIAVATTITGEVSSGWWVPTMLGLLVSVGMLATGAVLGVARLAHRRQPA